MATQIKLRRDTDANWTTNSTVVLAEGEIGVNLTSGEFKLGDGASTWAQLTYFAPGSTTSTLVNGANTVSLGADGATTVPGLVTSTAQQMAFINVDNVGISIDSFNTPTTVDIGFVSSNDYARFKFGAGTTTGNTGDVELISPAIGDPGVPSTITISPQDGQNGSFKFNGDGTLTLPGSGTIDGSSFDINLTASTNGVDAYGTVSLITTNPGSGTNSLTFNSLGEIAVSSPGANDGLVKWVGNSSGDGNGYNTLVLVPDDTVEGNDQYIIIDPTVPGHIHIRAGGTQDASNAFLILGGEETNVTVLDTNHTVTVNTWNGVDANYNWIFDNDGSLTVPGSIVYPDSTAQATAYNPNSIGLAWTISASGTSDYVFSGPGIFTGNTDDPVLYLYRGFTYTFVNTTASAHPFAIRVSNGGADYTTGVSGSQTGTQTFTVPMNAPSTLYYQCTIHSVMGNVINIV